VEHARLTAGSYISSRHFENSFLSLFNLLQVQVSANGDGTLTISSERKPDGRLKVWRETGPFQWREVDGQDRLEMRVDQGRVVAIQLSSDPSSALVPVPGWLHGSWIYPALVAALAVLLVTVVRWRPFLRGRPRPDASPPVGADSPARTLAWLGALSALTFIVGWVLLLRRFLSGDPSLYVGGLDLPMRLLQVIGLAMVGGAAAAAWKSWRAIRAERGWATRIGGALVTGSLLFVVWFAFVFRLIARSLEF
jgi:hypothetical protein